MWRNRRKVIQYFMFIGSDYSCESLSYSFIVQESQVFSNYNMEMNVINIPYWNRKHLIAPTMISRPLTCQNPAEISAKLSKILKKIISSLTEISCLDLDAALISRLIFRMKKVFRHDKLLQCMQKINRCLTSLLEINIIIIVKELDDCTHENNGPTKEMLQWALLSLQRYAVLLHILIARCTAIVPILNNKLSTGHHWNIATIIFGVIGRIWVLSRHMCKKSCVWYRQLGRFLPRVQKLEENSMFSTHNFPQDLADWLENITPSLQTADRSSLNVNKESVKTVDTAEVQNEEKEILKSAMYFNEDLGEVISRDSLNDNKKSENKHTKITRISFTCSAHLFKFIHREKSLRKKDITAAQTKYLDNKRWNRLYESLTDLLRQLHRLTDEEHRRKQDILEKANLLVAKFVKI